MDWKGIGISCMMVLLVFSPLFYTSLSKDPEVKFEYDSSHEITRYNEIDVKENPFNIQWFEPFEFTSMEFDEASNVLYLGTEHGLFIKNLTTDEYWVVSQWEGLDDLHIVDTALDRDHSYLYIVTNGNSRVYILDLEKRIIIMNITLLAHDSLFSYSRFRTLHYIPEYRCLYAGMTGGLLRLNMMDYSMKFWDLSYMQEVEMEFIEGWTHYTTIFTIKSIEYSPIRESLFITTSIGMSRFSIENETFENVVDLELGTLESVRDSAWDANTETLALVSDYSLFLFKNGEVQSFNLSDHLNIDFNYKEYFDYDHIKSNGWCRFYTVDFISSGTLAIFGYTTEFRYRDENGTWQHKGSRNKILLTFSIFNEKITILFRDTDYQLSNFPVFTALHQNNNEIIAAMRIYSEEDIEWNISYHREVTEKRTSVGGLFENSKIEDKSRWKVETSMTASETRFEGQYPLGRLDLGNGNIEPISITGNIRSPNDGLVDAEITDDLVILDRKTFILNRDFSETYPINRTKLRNDGENIIRITNKNDTFGEYYSHSTRYGSSQIHNGSVYFIDRDEHELLFFDINTLEYGLVMAEEELLNITDFLYYFKVIDDSTFLFCDFSCTFNTTSEGYDLFIEFRMHDDFTGSTTDLGRYYLFPGWRNSSCEEILDYYRILFMDIDSDNEKLVFSLDPYKHTYLVDLINGEITTINPFLVDPILWLSYEYQCEKIAFFNGSEFIAQSQKGMLTDNTDFRPLIPMHQGKTESILITDFTIIENLKTVLAVPGYVIHTPSHRSSNGGFGAYILDYGNNRSRHFHSAHGLPHLGSGTLHAVHYNEETGIVEVCSDHYFATVSMQELDENNTRPESGAVTIMYWGEESEVFDYGLDSSLMCSLSIVIPLGLIVIWMHEGWKYRIFSGIPLYSKLKHGTIATQKNREKLINAIKVNPGITYNRLRREVELGNGVISHHLKILEREKEIISRNNGTYKHFFLKGTKLPSVLRYLNITQSAIIYNLERSDTPLCQKDLQESTGSSSSTISYNLDKLLRKKVVRRKINSEGSYLYSLED